ncbi:SpoIIE family protein phosphatase [Thalassobaculum salexigens]|uniref:SpoIIE family protein phosphatase n=1 Tax=Thalassobaculum salexigens TaxID=455360 RepID=UPI00248EEA82|nr:SpoIIE family protein phosphatase [Thalassobaculum salexigens]
MRRGSPIFESVVRDPDLASLRILRHGLRDALGRSDIPRRLAQDLQLALQEYATNLIVHGAPAPAEITVHLHNDGAVWELEIFDDGGAFQNFDAYLALATFADRRQGPRSHGMGMKFIGTRFADYEYDAGNGFTRPNRLSLHFPPRAEFIIRPVIVVIEDEPLTRQLIKSILRRDFRVFDFELPGQALRLIRSYPPDLILSDIGLPEMDGIALRKELARDIDTDIVPFVFLSAHGDERTMSEAGDLGIDDFVPKPIDPPILLRIARRLITRSRKVREALIAKSAKDLTEGLQPNLPARFEGFDIGFASEPASLGGGDLIQSGQIGDRLIVLLADVMGHGLAARFYAHGVAAYFRAIILGAEPGTEIDDLMTQLSDSLFADPTFERTIVSIQLVALDREGGVEICSAGHPFPVVIAGGTARWAEISGPLPALEQNLPFPTMRLEPEPGSRLLLYTDGLSEVESVRRNPAAAGDRLFDMLRRHADDPVVDMPSRVLEDHLASTRTLADDTSLIAIGRRRPG